MPGALQTIGQAILQRQVSFHDLATDGQMTHDDFVKSACPPLIPILPITLLIILEVHSP